MKLNIPPKIRARIYILTALGTPVVAYLKSRHLIGDAEVALWSSEVAAVGAMAALNITPDKK